MSVTRESPYNKLDEETPYVSFWSGKQPDTSLADDNTEQPTTVWSMTREFVADLAAVIQAALNHYGMNDVHVIENGVFETSMLHEPPPPDHPTGGVLKSRPFISINLTSDVASRESLGEILSVATKADPGFILDPQNILNDDNVAIVKNQMSTVTADISVYDLNLQRANQMRLFVKTLMFACEATFASFGYIKPPLRTGSSWQTGIVEMAGGERMVFERTLTYEAAHFDFIAGIDDLARLIQAQSKTVAALDPDGLATISVNLETESAP